jgi:hypothetical protein
MHTPGFERENETKPFECVEIEKGEPVYEVDYTSRAIIDGVRCGDFHIACGDFGIGLLTRVTAGMSPRSNIVLDSLFGLLLPAIGFFVRGGWDSIVQKTADERRAAAAAVGAAAAAASAAVGDSDTGSAASKSRGSRKGSKSKSKSSTKKSKKSN